MARTRYYGFIFLLFNEQKDRDGTQNNSHVTFVPADSPYLFNTGKEARAVTNLEINMAVVSKSYSTI